MLNGHSSMNSWCIFSIKKYIFPTLPTARPKICQRINTELPSRPRACMRACPSLSCVQICNTLDYSPRGSSVHGILQARMHCCGCHSHSRGTFWPRDQTPSSVSAALAVGSLPLLPMGRPIGLEVASKHHSLRARVLQWNDPFQE